MVHCVRRLTAREFDGTWGSSVARVVVSPRVPTEDDESGWVARIRTGDVRCFTMLFDRYAEPLCRYVHVHVGARHIAEEIVQDLFCALWTHRHTWDVPGPLKMYLYKAAKNRTANFHRHTRTELAYQARVAAGEQLHPYEEPGQSDDAVAVHDLASAVARAVAKMPDRARQVWTLSREHALTYAEIADLLNLSVKTVEVHMGRALTVLRTHLTDWRE